MKKIIPYLNFEGKTEEAFNFYKSVLGGKFSSFVRFKDMPMPGVQLSEEEENRIMHISLALNNEDILMASDSIGPRAQQLVQGNNIYIFIDPDSKQEADRIFNALSTGGKIEMPMQDAMWGDYYGSFQDKFGINWMLNYIYPKEK